MAELAGLVLTILPLVIEANRAYAHHGTAFHKAVFPASRDKALQEFYTKFWWETVELSKSLETVVYGLPGLSLQRKQEVLEDKNIENWVSASDVEFALRNYFNTREDYLTFQMVLEKVIGLLFRLIKDDTVQISKNDMDRSSVYRKMKQLQEDNEKGLASSSFRERFRFLRREKDRNNCLANLGSWNQRIKRVIEFPQTKTRPPFRTGSKAPPVQARILSNKLFTALSESWTCQCDQPHEARFCLESCQKLWPHEFVVYFDFLLSWPSSQSSWYEATVTIKDTKEITVQTREKLQTICEAITEAKQQTTDYCLQILVEDLQTSQQLWLLNWREPQYTHLRTTKSVPFHILIEHHAIPPLIERRRLSLTFAYSLLQLHESPWLSKQWEKDCIHFFHKSQGGLDLRRPYLTTTFDQFPSRGEEPHRSVFHRNMGILRLGILLIEIHMWKPIEALRSLGDCKDGIPTPNTDLQVAKRVVGQLHDCFPTYIGAIESCLRVPWVGTGCRVSLSDDETWKGFYEDVIGPLEQEVALGNGA